MVVYYVPINVCSLSEPTHKYDLGHVVTYCVQRDFPVTLSGTVDKKCVQQQILYGGDVWVWSMVPDGQRGGQFENTARQTFSLNAAIDHSLTVNSVCVGMVMCRWRRVVMWWWRALEFYVEGEKRERMKNARRRIGFICEDTLCWWQWIVGVDWIATGLRWIRSPLTCWGYYQWV